MTCGTGETKPAAVALPLTLVAVTFASELRSSVPTVLEKTFETERAPEPTVAKV